MKRKFYIAAAALAAVLGMFAFAACGGGDEGGEGGGGGTGGAGAAEESMLGDADVQLARNDTTAVVFTVTEGDEERSLYDVLAAYRTLGVLTFTASGGEDAAFITSVNGVENADPSYWMVYTTLGEYEGVSYSDAAWGTWEYEGDAYASASYGVSLLPLVAGESYALVYTDTAA